MLVYLSFSYVLLKKFSAEQLEALHFKRAVERAEPEKKPHRLPPATVLKIPFHKGIYSLNLNKILKTYVNLYCIKCPVFAEAFLLNPPVICWTKAKNFSSLLTNSKDC
jgi:hypothetical protein